MAGSGYLLKSTAIFDSVQDRTFSGFVAVQGNRIAGTGSDEGTAGYWEEQGFEVIDCGDGLIIPGMIDAHMHFFDGIFQNSRYMCRDLFDCRSAEECVKVIGDFARKHPEYRTVTGMGWFPPGWTDSRRPDKKMLDEIEPDRPVYLMCADGHSFWLNSRALEDCGVDPGRKLAFGEIETYENGEANGVLHEMDACAPCSVKAQALPEETSRELIGDFLEQLSRAGITGTTDITVLPEPAEITENMRIIRELELENRLSVRLHLYPSLGMDDSFRIVEGYRQEFQSDKFRVSGLKAFIDGVHSNHTAFLLSPYTDSPGEKGSTFYPQEHYRHMVTAANRAGYGVKLHCTGEGAVHMALDALAASAHAKCSSGVRNSIEHVETFCEDDIDRFHELDVTASMQPSHLMFLGDTLRVKLGPERASRQYALKTMLDHDVNVAFSTDYPVAPFDPRLNIYFAVTRCDPEGNPVDRGSGQEITLAQAIRAYTRGSAYCLGREEELGTLEKGKLADIAVFDRDLFRRDPAEILEAEVVLTMMDGDIVYRKQGE